MLTSRGFKPPHVRSVLTYRGFKPLYVELNAYARGV
jgi:hypothetical protein